MPPKSSRDLPKSPPRKDTAREMQQAIVEDADKTEATDRDLEHGDGGTLGLPTGSEDLNHDD
jgi:hypothetical protein